MIYIGIDVSKDSFVAAYPAQSGYTTKTFKNTSNGVHEFITSLPADSHCVMEATGNYSMLLLYLLQTAGKPVSMENPQKIKHFSRAMLSVTKTDEIDAKMIALYGEKMNPKPYKIPAESILFLKQKRTVLRQLKKQLTATRNLQEALSVLPMQDPKSKTTLEQTIQFLKDQIAAMEKRLLTFPIRSIGDKWKCLHPLKALAKQWHLRSSPLLVGSPISVTPSRFHAISGSALHTNNQAHLLISKVISIETEIPTCEVSYMLPLLLLYDVMINVKKHTKNYVKEVKQGRWLLLRSLTNSYASLSHS